MSDNSKIEWTDASWNPVTGCTRVSPGCGMPRFEGDQPGGCYAEMLAERFRGTPGHYFENGFDVQLRPDKLDQPLRWKKPRRIFVNSMSDLFHDDVPDEYIARVFAVMAQTPQHTYQILTKRHGRMRSLLGNMLKLIDAADATGDERPGWALYEAPWPLPNVHLGVSVEDQRWADIRIPALLETPAAVRFLSCEPLLGPVDLWGPVDQYGGRSKLTYWLDGRPGWGPEETSGTGLVTQSLAVGRRIDWVIVGGESGPGARPMHPDWARTIRDQCAHSGVSFHFKQWGEYLAVPVEDDPQFAGGRAYADPRGGRSAAVLRQRGPSGTFRAGEFRPMRPGDETRGTVMLDANTIAVRVGKKAAGRELDGRTWDEMPRLVTS
uniref:DUF5131 family protein n=1 Tax=Streptosporangium sp. CA-235898 TaxID=3240073 RepID=UPI003F4951F1